MAEKNATITAPKTEDAKEIKKEAEKAPKQPRPRASYLSIITCFIALSSLGLGIYNYNEFKKPVVNFGSDGNSASFKEGSVAEVAASVADSVVSITTEIRTKSWFGTESTSSAAGTGFIISDKGYIMTNRHVVEDAKTVNVTLNNGDYYEDVDVIGVDPLNDSAIIKVDDPKDFKAIKIGDSKTVFAGQQVVVIGNALGEYQNSVTAGIISGMGRELVASDQSGASYEKLTDMIQTDAAINGGNSGGPVINAAGEVIGIATAYASSSQTVGFAIPIANVKGTIRSVLEDGEYSRAVIGVNYVSITPAVAEEYDLPVRAGAYLSEKSSIISGGAGDKAGLKKKDIITEVNGIKIGKAGSLSTLVGEYKAGETIKLKIIRDEKEKEVEVTLKAYKED